MSDSLRRLVPNVVTLLGLALTLAWLRGAPWWIGLVGLTLDACDGALARRLGAVSEFGSLFDWTCDVIASGLVLVHLDLASLLVALVPMQVWARQRPVRISGRAALTAIALAWQWWAR